MKASVHFRHFPQKLTVCSQLLTYTTATVLIIYSGNALAQSVDFPSVPLTVSTAVPSNLLYIHDDSNSMHWSFMPDEASARKSAKFHMSPDYNNIYYNPDFKYVPPPAPPGVNIVDADNNPVKDGTLGNAKFTNAWFNGYDIQYRNMNGTYARDLTGATLSPRYDLSKNYRPTDYQSALTCAQNLVSTCNPFIGTSISASGEFLYNTLVTTSSGYYYYRCPGITIANAGSYADSKCTGHTLVTDEEKQNFANWYSYYRTRMYASKGGVGRAFEKLDASVRVGWGLINKSAAASVDGKSVTMVMQGVRNFDINKKKEFLDWLYKIQHGTARNSPYFLSQLGTSAGSNTPLRRALDAAGQYYDRANGSIGPWADDPTNPKSTALEKAAACRKSFTVLMTDGYWNGDAAATSAAAGNADGTAPVPFKDSYSGTLADVAWYYWSRDLLTSVANNVPKTPEPGALVSASPKYRDDAVHQHMTTFTIGMGVAGTIAKDKAFKAMHDPSIVFSWPNGSSSQIDDLLHAAVNGHGDFFSAGNPDEFVQGMSSIINAVNSAQKASSGNVDASTSQVTPVSGDVYTYKTFFKPDNWSGELFAEKFVAVQSPGGAAVNIPVIVWRASEQMPSPVDRKIYTRSSSGVGIPFMWANLDSTLQTAMKGPGQLLDGQKVLEYVRGSSANEGQDTGQFRPRYRAATNRAPLGDSPHNSPVFVKYGSSRTVFLGANDGMLHAFNADNGVEQFAYIPSALLSKLAELTNGNNSYVDGEILVTTPAQTPPNKYLLVGALGRGGKGLYGLDVTNPASFQSDSHVKWELNSPQVCPALSTSSDYLGNVVGSLTYAEISGQPRVVFGNGYNSCRDKAALGTVDISNGNVTFIQASDETGNGLASPFIQADSTSNTVLAYAGDLRGKMWKFGLVPLLSTSQKFFDTGTSNQPITAKPVAASINTEANVRKTFLYFGTGRYLILSDRSTTTQQNIYGVVDENTASSLTNSNLQLRTLGPVYYVDGEPRRDILSLPGGIDASKKGWYVPLTDSGERVVSAPIVYHDPRGDVVIFSTIVPPIDGNPCDSKGSGWVYALNAQTGGKLDFPLFDWNGDGKFDAKDISSGFKIGDRLGGMPGQCKIVNGYLICRGIDTDEDAQFRMYTNPGTTNGGRISWREITN